MANEIKISLSITVEKDGAKFTRQESFLDDMTGDAWTSGVQQVGAASEDLITHEDITTYGWIYLKNLGGNVNNYVDFGHNTAALNGDDNICRLYGGESCILKCSAGEGSAATVTALHAISSSGTQAVEYAIIEL
jgi:hypothetical protein